MQSAGTGTKRTFEMEWMWLCVTFYGWLSYLAISVSEPTAVYEIQLVAYNGNGDGTANKRLVSLAESGTSAKTSSGETQTLTFKLI